ncbi:MAG: RecQ family ATP-dependent DNA helicase [Candidatus Dormibacteria bacterium]
MSPHARAILEQTFGLSEFRPGQAEVVGAAEAGRDVLFVAPTGSGKSIAYWVPGVAGGGLTLVVSPLIALMVDQVARLNALGVAAECVHSQMNSGARAAAIERAGRGELRFLYVAPERIAAPGFLGALGRLTVGSFVVDEAHCISSWGHDFRPDYRRLGDAVEACRRPPVWAFTATATPRVRDDIVQSLGLVDPLVQVTGFVRDNLTMSVIECRGRSEKREALLRRINPGAGRALVYCGRRADAEDIAQLLGSHRIPAASYHGALAGEDRQDTYTDFASGELKVIVATSAFGMGVDFADIRQVIHFDFPGSLEEYYQQAGRAGRDGLPSECVLLYSPADRQLQEFFVEQAYPERDTVRAVYREMLRAGHAWLDDWPVRLPEVDSAGVRAALNLLQRAGAVLPDGGVNRLTAAPVDFAEQAALKEHAYARVNQVMEYARTRGCRHARIADYFGQQGVARSCSSCDNCLDPPPATEAVPDAQLMPVLAAVARFDGFLGAARLAQVLRGAEDAWTRERQWVLELPFFGALRDWDLNRIRDLVAELVEVGAVQRSHGEKPTLRLTALGRDAISGEVSLEVALSPAGRAAPARALRRAGGAAPLLEGADEALFLLLCAWRRDAAQAQQVPAYVVFHDRTLADIAHLRPGSIAQLATVKGVGPAKLDRYGEDVLRVVAQA